LTEVTHVGVKPTLVVLYCTFSNAKRTNT